MELSEWIRQFFDEGFKAEAEHADEPVCSLNPHWPNGAPFDPLKPFYNDDTEKTYETLDEVVDEVGQKPSSISFGVVKFG